MVLLAEMPGSISDGLPTSMLAMPPLPFWPWQAEQPLVSNSLAPSVAVPLPGGKPAPSRRMVTFQALTSASETGLPRCGASAARTANDVNTTAEKRRAHGALGIDMLDLPFAVDAPGGETVVVLVGKRVRALHRLFGYAAHRHEIGAQRLRCAGIVPGTTRQRYW